VLWPTAHGGPRDSVRIDACVGGRCVVTLVPRGAGEGFVIRYEDIGVPLVARAHNTWAVQPQG
jgi:hypothetical protein